MDSSDERSRGRGRQPRAWFKSSYSSAASTCVEVSYDPIGQVSIRDSKYALDATNDPLNQPVIRTPVTTWQQLSERILTNSPLIILEAMIVRIDPNGSATFHCLQTGTILAYTRQEYSAFKAGLRAGEFRPQFAV